MFKNKYLQSLLIIALLTSFIPKAVSGQTDDKTQEEQPSINKYVDETSGMTADEAVVYALAHNGELVAARKEIDAAKALVKQAKPSGEPYA